MRASVFRFALQRRSTFGPQSPSMSTRDPAFATWMRFSSNVPLR